MNEIATKQDLIVVFAGLIFTQTVFYLSLVTILSRFIKKTEGKPDE